MDASHPNDRRTGPVPAGRAREAPPELLTLLVAVAAGTVAQGGYYAAGRILVTVAVAAAVLAWWSGRGSAGAAAPQRAERPALRAAIGWPVATAAGALALWALVRGVQSGGYDAAVAAGWDERTIQIS